MPERIDLERPPEPAEPIRVPSATVSSLRASLQMAVPSGRPVEVHSDMTETGVIEIRGIVRIIGIPQRGAERRPSIRCEAFRFIGEETAIHLEQLDIVGSERLGPSVRQTTLDPTIEVKEGAVLQLNHCGVRGAKRDGLLIHDHSSASIFSSFFGTSKPAANNKRLQCGIAVHGTGSLQMERSAVMGCRFVGVDIATHGVVIVKDSRIEGNDKSGVWISRAPASSSSPLPIPLPQPAVFQNNSIKRNGGHGLGIEAGSRADWKGGEISDNTQGNVYCAEGSHLSWSSSPGSPAP